jgi:hypothetical protein
MKPLDRESEAIFKKLTDGLTKVGDCRRINGSLVVQFTEQTKLGPLFLITHFEEGENGFLVRDANVAFLISSIKTITGDLVPDMEKRIYPVSYRRNGLNEEALEADHGRWNVHLELQNKICRFADEWMLNISEEENL